MSHVVWLDITLDNLTCTEGGREVRGKSDVLTSLHYPIWISPCNVLYL